MNDLEKEIMAIEANELLPHMLELAKRSKASSFSIAALAVIKAYVETNPGLAAWVGSMLAEEGMRMLETHQLQANAQSALAAMPTSSIH